MTPVFRQTAVLVWLLMLAPGSWVRGADTSRLMDTAVQSFNQGQYKKAMKQFLNVLQIDPNNAEAKEYRNRCMDKIVEDELGLREQKPGKTPFRVAPAETTPPRPTPSEGGRRPLPGTARPQSGVPNGPAGSPATAGALLQQRTQLVEDYRQRVLGKENAVRVTAERNGLDIVLYLNRLFLPMTDQFATDAYPALEAAVQTIRAAPGKPVSLKAVDNLSPAVRHARLDLPARRSAIVFSYLVHATLDSRRPAPNAPILTAVDLAE